MRRAQQIQSSVIAFLNPVFTETAPNGRKLNGLAPDDFEKVRQGFACADCLAVFATYTVTCPVCGLTRDVAADIGQAPELWTQHLREREQPWTAVDKPRPVNPYAAINQVKNDKDVEQIDLRKLRNTRKRL